LIHFVPLFLAQLGARKKLPPQIAPVKTLKDHCCFEKWRKITRVGGGADAELPGGDNTMVTSQVYQAFVFIDSV